MFYLNFLFVFFFYFNSTFTYGFSDLDKINNIYVTKLSKTSENVVKVLLQEIGIKERSSARRVDISKLTIMLIQLDLFTSVLVERFKNTLMINIIENPVNTGIFYTGILFKKKLVEFLKEQKIQTDFICNLQQIGVVKTNINEYFFYSGYYISKVKVKYVYNLNLNLISFFITIQDNTRCRNKYIFFSDAVSFLRSEALESIKLVKNVNFFYDVMEENILLPVTGSFLNNIKYDYYNNGYVTCRVGCIQRVPCIDLNNINSYIEFYKGQRFYIHNILLKSSCIGRLNFLHYLTLENMFFGAYFNRKSVVMLRDMFSYYIKKNGFFYNSISIVNVKDFKNRCIDVYFTILCKKRVINKSLIFLGTNVMDLEIIEKNNKHMSHYSWFSMETLGSDKVSTTNALPRNTIHYKIQKFKNDIFKWVNVTYNLGGDRKTQIQGNLSYSNIDGFVYTLGANLPDFLGSGKEIDFMLESNKVVNNYVFTIYNPYFLSKGFGFGCNFSYNIQNLYSPKNCTFFKYVTDGLGFSFFFTITSFLHNRVNLHFGYEWLNFKYTKQNIMYDVAKFLSYVGKSYKEYYMDIFLTYDTLDKIIFPTDGFLQDIKLHFSLPVSDIIYYKFDYSYSFFKKINDLVFNTTLDLGYIYNYGIISALPFSKYYFLGGITGVKGYGDSTLGTKCTYGENDSNLAYFGGTFYLNTRFSFILPSFYSKQEDIFRILSFFDLGYIQNFNVSRNNSILDYNNIFGSLGFSFVWNSPFDLPIELTLALPILCRDDKITQFLSFTTM